MAYNRALVEHLLPAVWDQDAAYGIRNPHAPDHDMPKARPNPKTGNTIAAHLADIRSAWRKAPISPEEQRALFMRFCLDWEYGDIGRHDGVHKSTAQRRCESGVGRITAWLNGDEYVAGYDNDDLNEVAAA
jgi:DNA-directed RNA polymerase specialized sigma24 family protein